MLTSSSAVSQGKTKLPQPKSSTGNKEITIFGKDKDSGESGEEDVENTRPLAGSSIPTGGPTGPGGSIMHKDTSATAATRAKKLKPTIVLSKNASISSFFKRLGKLIIWLGISPLF